VRAEFERRLARLVPADDLYLSLEQVCRRFDISRGTVWKWRKQRGLKQSKVGKCTFFRVVDIRAVIEGGFSR
jgi:transposase-like protein